MNETQSRQPYLYARAPPSAYVTPPLAPQTSSDLRPCWAEPHAARQEVCLSLRMVTCITFAALGVSGAALQSSRREGIPAPPPRSSCDAVSHIRSSAGEAECLFGNLAITSEGIPLALALTPRAGRTRPRLRSAAPPRGLVLIGC